MTTKTVVSSKRLTKIFDETAKSISRTFGAYGTRDMQTSIADEARAAGIRLNEALLAAGYRIHDGYQFGGEYRYAATRWVTKGDEIRWSGNSIESSARKLSAVFEDRRRTRIEMEEAR